MRNLGLKRKKNGNDLFKNGFLKILKRKFPVSASKTEGEYIEFSNVTICFHMRDLVAKVRTYRLLFER